MERQREMEIYNWRNLTPPPPEKVDRTEPMEPNLPPPRKNWVNRTYGTYPPPWDLPKEKLSPNLWNLPPPRKKLTEPNLQNSTTPPEKIDRTEPMERNCSWTKPIEPKPNLWNLTPPPPQGPPKGEFVEPNLGSVQAHKEVNRFKQKKGEPNRTYRTEPLSRTYWTEPLPTTRRRVNRTERTPHPRN